MSSVSRYLAEIGRRGGIRSRRVLEPKTARRMVEIREARRIAQRTNSAARLGGTPADTGAAAQAIQDGLLQRTAPGAKLAQVARLSRMVDRLAIAGIRLRHEAVDEEMIRYLRAELRLGRELAARVYGARRDGA
jgi:hypothetical protein